MRAPEFEKFIDSFRQELKTTQAEEKEAARLAALRHDHEVRLWEAEAFQRDLDDGRNGPRRANDVNFRFYVREFELVPDAMEAGFPKLARCDHFVPDRLSPAFRRRRTGAPASPSDTNDVGVLTLPIEQVKVGGLCPTCCSADHLTIYVGHYEHRASEWYSEWHIDIHLMCTYAACATLTPVAKRVEAKPIGDLLSYPHPSSK